MLRKGNLATRCVALAIIAGSLVLPAQAMGNQHEPEMGVSTQGDKVVLIGYGPGNGVSVNYRDPSFQEVMKGAEGAYVVYADGAYAGNSGCKNAGTYKVECLDVGLTGVTAYLGEGADMLRLNRGTQAVPKSDVNRIYGGGGSDSLRGGKGADYINGEGGNDSATGAGGADQLGSLMGLDADDWDNGKDAFRGGRGKDRILARDLAKDKLIDCGAGDDKARRDKNVDPKPVSC